MLIKEILSERLQDFIRQLEDEDPKTIVLKNKTIPGIPASFIADQVSGRKKAKEKIPDYSKNPFVVFPPQVNLEQSSSQVTAWFKSEFIRKNISACRNAADLTGGFGVDTFFLSKIFHSIDYVDPEPGILEIAKHNHEQLGARNIRYHQRTAAGFLDHSEEKFDFIFIDPSRRKEGNRKVNSLTQSEPDVVQLQNLILDRSGYCLIKASPLFDINVALKELKHVRIVVVVSVKNECRELLFFQDAGFGGEPVVQAVNITSGNRIETFEFMLSSERTIETEFSAPKKYLYEPNASILKAGAFKTISKTYKLPKVHPNTHLYTSDKLLKEFPGRIFSIESVVKSDPKTLEQFFPGGKANVLTRNYPLSVDELKKKLRLTDGDLKFLIGFTGIDKKYLVVAERINE